MAVPHASLKVYEPLEAFAPQERASLLAPAHATATSSIPSIVLSRSRGIDDAPLSERSDVIHVGERVFVCPHRARLRLLAALVAFRRGIPPEVAGAFMPLGEEDRAVSEIERIRREHPDWRSHILTSTWEVPVRWFVAFDDAEREHDPSVPSLRYRTTMALARARTERALDAARSAVVGPGVTALVSEMSRWLSIFHEDSVVELDYGLLARLVDPEDLAADRSAADLQAALTAMARDDLVEATAHYMRAAERWAPLAALERTN